MNDNRKVKELHKERIKMWNESIRNHDKYKDCSGLFKSMYTVFRKCPVCNSERNLELFNKEGGTYVRCLECDMVFLNPVLEDQYLEEYYEKNHQVQSEIVESDTDGFYRDLYNKGLDSVFEINRNVSNILDIGCSSGFFLDIAKEKIAETHGIELNLGESEIARKRGHHVHTHIDEIKNDIKFDLITLWDVFEHIVDGKALLEKCKSRLSKNGIIFMQIPSSDSLAARILQERCNMFDGLEHVNLYGSSSIKKIAKSCNMKIYSINSVISEVGVINNYINYDDPYFGERCSEYILNLITPEEILKNNLGYKLQVLLSR